MSGQTLDPERIFAALQAHKVQYVLVGGIAVQAQAEGRSTSQTSRR